MNRPGTLIGLTVVALALAVVVAVDRPTATTVRSRRIVPELQRAVVASVVVTHADGDVVELRRTADGDFDLPGDAVIDDEAARALLGALDLLSYRRRVDAGDAAMRHLDEPVAAIAVALESGTIIELRVGGSAEVGDLVWLARGDRADHYLVDGYAARALAPRVDDLRSRRVFDAERVTGVEIYRGDARLVLGGAPDRMAVHLGGRIRASASAVTAIVSELRKLRITRFVPGAGAPEPDTAALSVRVVGAGGAQELDVLGPCPGDDASRLVASRVGTGCVGADRLEALAGWLDRAGALVETRLIAGRITAIVAGDVRLTSAGGTWKLGDTEADADAVGDWIDAVNRAASGETTIDAGAPVFDLVIEYGAGDPDTIHVQRASDGRLLARREGDERALVLAADSALAAAPSPIRFRSRQLLLMQPTAGRALVARRGATVVEHLERGQLIGDWTVVAGNAAVIAATVRATRDALAHLRAVRFVPGAGPLAERRTVEVVFDPPPVGDSTEPIRHEVHLGASTSSGGCRARLDDDPAVFELDADTCDGLLGPWTR